MIGPETLFHAASAPFPVLESHIHPRWLCRRGSSSTGTPFKFTGHLLRARLPPRVHAVILIVVFICVTIGVGAQTSTNTPTVTVSASPSPTVTITPSATPTQTSICASGWTHYADTNGTEGRDSCLQKSASQYSSWLTASMSCPLGSHLVTIYSPLQTTGLGQLVSNLTSGSNTWFGCSQSSSATIKNGGWGWVDGTANGNLNCGAANTLGCGLWQAGEPNDFPNSVESGTENWCVGVTGFADVSLNYGTLYSICEYEVSYRCPYGWTYYRDDGSEGQDSCVLMSTTNATSWAVANSSCQAVGSHLLTIGSSVPATGLTAFASSLYNSAGQYVYIGCSQNSTTGDAGSGWAWVDGTSPGYLNCGSGIGCFLWNNTQPSFPSLGFCGLVSGNYYGDVYHSAITSLSGNLSRPYVCEMELPSTSPSPTPTRTATSSSTPSYLSSLTISPTSTPTLSLTPSVSISASPTPSPTVTQSMICASGWTHYEDVDGTEGRDSCLRLTAVNYTYWVDASVNCPVGSHLLTVSSSSIAGGLPQLVFAIVSGAASWLGCSQSSSATWMNGGWSWVDGTPNGNLNCGAPNAMYCGVWATAEPNDGGASVESGVENFCNGPWHSNTGINDCSINAGPLYGVCEYEVSYGCPYGWTYYRDDGSEGQDSCVLMSTSNATSWAAANSSCPAGSHLLTIGSSVPATGLTAFASSLYYSAGQYMYIGCSQNSSASSAGSGWSWVDATTAGHLNCGSGIGCYLWNSGQPSVAGYPSLGYCALVSGNYYGDVYNPAIASVSGNMSRPYVCEIELSSPSPSPSVSPTAASSVTPSYGSSVTITPTGSVTVSFTPSVSVSPSPSASASSICGSGWAHYNDSNGSEGRDSCLQKTASSYLSWAAASVSCPVGSHLLTILSTSQTSGLNLFASVFAPGASCWYGCSQSSSATLKNGGWGWIDGTSSGNLNCGAANSLGCGLWAATEPSDGGSSMESGLENWCIGLWGGGTGINDGPSDLGAYGPVYGICEYEVSSSCPLGWIYYRDDGSEGQDSCVLISSGNATSWAVANSSCQAVGSHLLTIGSSVPATGLTAFASSLYNSAGQYVYIGCSQNSSANSAGSGWSWVDSTSPGYLNCGSGTGCDLWNNSQPSVAGYTSLGYCGLVSGNYYGDVYNPAIASVAGNVSRPYVCEIELPSASPSPTPSPTSSPTPSPAPPSRYSSSLVQWFDAADPYGNGTGLSNGTQLSIWVDKSPSGVHFQQSMPGVQPVVSVDPNGYPNVQFSGQSMSNTYTQNGTGGRTSFVVLWDLGTVAGDAFGDPPIVQFGNTSGSAGQSWRLCFAATTGALGVNINNGAKSSVYPGQTTSCQGGIVIGMWAMPPGGSISTAFTAFNGYNQTAVVASTGLGTSLNVTYGLSTIGSSTYTRVYEYLHFNTLLAASDIETIVYYLATKWGVTTGVASASSTATTTPTESSTPSVSGSTTCTSSPTNSPTPSTSVSGPSTASVSLSATFSASGTSSASLTATSSASASSSLSTSPSATSTASRTVTVSLSGSPTVTLSTSATASLTASASATASGSSSVTLSCSMSPSITLSGSPTSTDSFTVTASLSTSLSRSLSSSASNTVSITETSLATGSVSVTLSATSTLTVSRSASVSLSSTSGISVSASSSPTLTVSASPSSTSSVTLTSSSSESASSTASGSPSVSVTLSASSSTTPSETVTVTMSDSSSDSRSVTISASASPSVTLSASDSVTFTASPTSTPSSTASVTQTPCPAGCTTCSFSNCSACDSTHRLIPTSSLEFQCISAVNPANVICTVADDAVSGAVLNCSSLPLSSLEVALALDGLTDGGAGVPQPFVIGSSTAGSMYLIETGPQLNSLQAPSLRLNVLTMPQYVIGASVCEPQSVSAIALNGTMLDYGHCQMSPSAITRFNITVTLIHVDKPPYFTIPSLNFTTSAVGSLWQPIWVPLSTVVVNPDPVYPYNITSFALLQGPCSSASAQYYLPFAIGPSDGSLYYSVAGGLSAWSSPVSLCILAVDGGQLNASLDVTVWLAPVPEQLIVSPFSLSITHYAPGASTTSVSVLFSPGSQAGVSWTVQPSTQPWLTYTSNTFASSIQFHINSTGLAGLKATLYETMLAVYTTDRVLQQNVSVVLTLAFGSGSISPATISQTLQPLFTADSSFQLFNAGPGPLSFSVDPLSRTVSASLGAGVDVQWGTVTPVYGSIPAQESVTFSLTASSALLPPGSFGATLVIHTNQLASGSSTASSVEQPIALGSGQSFNVAWSVQVVQAIAFPSQINATLSALQAPVSALVSVANFAGAALVITSSSSVSWMTTDDSIHVASAGSVTFFPIALSYPVWANDSSANPGTRLDTSIFLNCWRADVIVVGDSSLTAVELAAVLNASVDSLPRSLFFSPIPLNAVVVSVTTVVGSPTAAQSHVTLLSNASMAVNVGSGIHISLLMRDAGGYFVPPSEDVIGLVGVDAQLQTDQLNASSTLNGSAVATVTGVVASADNFTFIITLQPLAVGELQLNVSLNGILVGSSLSVRVLTASCGTNETAIDGVACACSAGYYYQDSAHCLPCPAGSYKPSASNADLTSCLPCVAEFYCLQGATEPSGECPSSLGFDCSSGVLTISPGYWSPPFANATVEASAPNSSLVGYKCLSFDSCVGGSVTETRLRVPSVCGNGYVGDMCSTCDTGWAHTGSGKCVQCHSTGVLIFSLIIVPSVVLAVIAVLVAVITHSPKQQAHTPATLHHWMSGKRESFFAYLRLLLELLQMTGLLMGMGSFEPQWLVVTISAFSGAAVGAGFSVTTWAPWVCVIGDNIVTQMWVQLILALCALPMALGIAALSVPLSRIIWKGRATKTPLQTRFLVSLSLLLYAMLLGCVRTATLGAVVANKPSYLGALPFDSRAAVTISIRTHNVVRFACFAALAVMGITFLAVGIAQVVYTRKCLTPPAYFSALTVGYKVAGYRYGMEALLLARKLAIIASGIAFQDAFWAVIACLATYGPMFKILIHWKPYATQGSQFDARLVQSVILLLLLLMLARVSSNLSARLLLALEALWCVLYFGTLSYLVAACWGAFRAMLSKPQLVQDFAASKSWRHTGRSFGSVAEVRKVRLRGDDTLEYARSSRVGRIQRLQHRGGIDRDRKESAVFSSPVMVRVEARPE